MNSPALPSNAACPRCGNEFRCGAKDGSCACFDLMLGDELRQALAEQYGSSDCLCLACLVELKTRASEARPG